MTGRRVALISATDNYEHAAGLRCCIDDARALQGVLSDPAIGAFDDIEVLFDFRVAEFRQTLTSFLAACSPEDVVLVHIAGHMGVDRAGGLAIIASDTNFDNLPGTDVSGEWLVRQLDACASRRVVLILDGCHSGAIGTMPNFVADFDTANAAGLAGRGRVVIASASPSGTAYEQYSEDTAKPRSFTDILVRGLRTGDADVDGDGLVSAFELFEYGYNETVANFDGNQRPAMRMFGGTPASITVAYHPTKALVGTTAHATLGLPAVVLSDIRNSSEQIRARAAWELIVLTESKNPSVRSQALLALIEMSQDPNLSIRDVVHRKLTASGEWWARGASPGDLVARFPRDELVDWGKVVSIFGSVNKLEIHVNGDINVQHAGGDIKGSAAGRKNKIKYEETTSVTPETVTELKKALESLADEASGSDLPAREKALALPAILWWAENIDSATEPPEAKAQASALRRAGEWMWKRTVSLAEAMPAAAVAAWVIEALKGATMG